MTKIKIEPGLLQALFRALDGFALDEDADIEISNEVLEFLRGLIVQHPDP